MKAIDPRTADEHGRPYVKPSPFGNTVSPSQTIETLFNDRIAYLKHWQKDAEARLDARLYRFDRLTLWGRLRWLLTGK